MTQDDQTPETAESTAESAENTARLRAMLRGDQFAPEAAELVQFLQQNPDVLIRTPGLLDAILPRDENGAVVDMQRFLIDRLRNEIETLRGTARHLINLSRNNMTTQSQTHAAVLAMIACPDPATLAHTTAEDLPALLGLDVATVGLEVNEALPETLRDSGLTLLPPGEVDALLGAGNDIRLREQADAAPGVYGDRGDVVRSDALARLGLGPGQPPALLALGSRHVGTFHPDDATELLWFLARVASLTLQRWLV